MSQLSISPLKGQLYQNLHHHHERKKKGKSQVTQYTDAMELLSYFSTLHKGVISFWL